MRPYSYFLPMIALGLATLVCGCNQQKSPQAAVNDIAAGQAGAAQEVADAHRAAAKDINSASQDLQNKSAGPRGFERPGGVRHCDGARGTAITKWPYKNA